MFNFIKQEYYLLNCNFIPECITCLNEMELCHDYYLCMKHPHFLISHLVIKFLHQEQKNILSFKFNFILDCVKIKMEINSFNHIYFYVDDHYKKKLWVDYNNEHDYIIYLFQLLYPRNFFLHSNLINFEENLKHTNLHYFEDLNCVMSQCFVCDAPLKLSYLSNLKFRQKFYLCEKHPNFACQKACLKTFKQFGILCCTCKVGIFCKNKKYYYYKCYCKSKLLIINGKTCISILDNSDFLNKRIK